jgi:hypothetical protein
MRHAQLFTTMNTYGGAFLEDKRKVNTEVTAALLAANFSAVWGFVGSPFRLSRLKLLMI